ncbi:hypothetical protein TIFTF001_000565 [Ficus carica]|uniref:Uncharacterized protein n=1 Tax=Ficus carica TaxID=3494 RepID=A0AA88CNB3_FICCA|nr:hypothetical protein TIFTF001_000565 [Ficus carica]
MGVFDGGNLRRAEVVGVPEDVEVAIGRRSAGGVVVYGEGEDEVEVDVRVYRHVGEFNVIELGSYVLPEEVSGRRVCLEGCE